MSRITAFVSYVLGLALVSACNSDSSSSHQEPLGDAGTGGATGRDSGTPPSHDAAEAGHRPVDAFNGDCASARWADVSDACWSCLCTACAATLNACNQDCTNVLSCTFDRHTLVNVGRDVLCEIRATVAECLTDPASQAVANPLTQFDSCLIGAHAAGHFRACEAECEIPYSGDVCQRYPGTPPPDGG